MAAYPKVLVLGSDPDASFLVEILAQFAAVTKLEKIPRVFKPLEGENYDAVFCPWESPEATWRTVLEQIQSLRLELPMIVFCHCGGEREWTEVLEAGAFDFLVPPYSSSQILALLDGALACGHGMKGCPQYAIGA
jgi:DNA-binding NtrC family response regulator